MEKEAIDGVEAVELASRQAASRVEEKALMAGIAPVFLVVRIV